MNMQLPTLEQLQLELKRTKQNRRFGSVLKGFWWLLLTIVILIAIAAFAFLSVIRIQGASMSPTLHSGDIVIAFKGAEIENGDLAAFYFNNQLLVKRVIAQSGDEVSMDSDGAVSINGHSLTESYVANLSLGDCDISFPYPVPQERLFVLGDERSVSLDSRHSIIGCIAPEQTVGRVFLRIWPLDQIGLIP